MGKDSGRRRGDKGFTPPGDSDLARASLDYVGIPYMWWFWLRVREFDFPAEDRARLLEACRGAGLICPNHPSLHEPVVIYKALRKLRQKPHFMMARSTMEQAGWMKPFLRGIGTYTIRRGTTDRPAFITTRKLLTDDKLIVIFPEGETYGINDVLIPFHEGVVQMGFWGVQDREKEGKDGPVRIAPVAIKYLYLQDMAPAIEASLQRLEAKLALPAEPGLSRYQRLRRVGFATGRVLEQEFGATPPEGDDLNEHIDAIFAALLARMERLLDVKVAPQASLQDNLRKLYAVVDSALYDDEAEKNEYERRMQAQHEPAWRAFERDLARLQTFQAVRDGYVAAHPSAERYLDVLGRLEQEVIGEAPVYGNRKVQIRVAEPIVLNDYWAAYKEDRREAVATVLGELRGRVLAMLETLALEAPPIDPPAA